MPNLDTNIKHVMTPHRDTMAVYAVPKEPYAHFLPVVYNCLVTRVHKDADGKDKPRSELVGYVINTDQFVAADDISSDEMHFIGYVDRTHMTPEVWGAYTQDIIAYGEAWERDRAAKAARRNRQVQIPEKLRQRFETTPDPYAREEFDPNTYQGEILDEGIVDID